MSDFDAWAPGAVLDFSDKETKKSFFLICRDKDVEVFENPFGINPIYRYNLIFKFKKFGWKDRLHRKNLISSTYNGRLNKLSGEYRNCLHLGAKNKDEAVEIIKELFPIVFTQRTGAEIDLRYDS